MKNFRTYQLAVQFYRLSQALALSGNARDQLQRASRSIVLNLAEGRGKPSLADHKRFFYIAMGSLRECQAILDLELLGQSEASALLDKLGAHLHRLIKNAVIPPK